MKKQTKERLLKNLKDYFTVRSPIRNMLFFALMVFFSAFIKFGILIGKEIIEGVPFNAFVYLFIMGVSFVIVSIGYFKLKGYFILPGTFVLFWIVLESKVDLISVASKLLALSIIVHLFILISEIIKTTNEENKKCKKKKNKQ